MNIEYRPLSASINLDVHVDSGYFCSPGPAKHVLRRMAVRTVAANVNFDVCLVLRTVRDCSSQFCMMHINRRK